MYQQEISKKALILYFYANLVSFIFVCMLED